MFHCAIDSCFTVLLTAVSLCCLQLCFTVPLTAVSLCCWYIPKAITTHTTHLWTTGPTKTLENTSLTVSTVSQTQSPQSVRRPGPLHRNVHKLDHTSDVQHRTSICTCIYKQSSHAKRTTTKDEKQTQCLILQKNHKRPQNMVLVSSKEPQKTKNKHSPCFFKRTPKDQQQQKTNPQHLFLQQCLLCASMNM